MAGIVKATVSMGWDAYAWDVVPDHCPALDADELEKRGGVRPICSRIYQDGSRRHCVHLIAVTRLSNANERVDPSSLLGGVPGHYERSQRDCGALCQAQRRNRPPGC